MSVPLKGDFKKLSEKVASEVIEERQDLIEHAIIGIRFCIKSISSKCPQTLEEYYKIVYDFFSKFINLSLISCAHERCLGGARSISLATKVQNGNLLSYACTHRVDPSCSDTKLRTESQIRFKKALSSISKMFTDASKVGKTLEGDEYELFGYSDVYNALDDLGKAIAKFLKDTKDLK